MSDTSNPVTRDFVELWEPRYNKAKYPVDFYLGYIAKAQNAASCEALKEYLLALLHWKDGKALHFVPGELHAKPNTVGPINGLAGSSLQGFARLFRAVVSSDEKELSQHTEALLDADRYVELRRVAGVRPSRGKAGSATYG